MKLTAVLFEEHCTTSFNPENVYLSPLHIKPWTHKNFVKTRDPNSAGLVYLKNDFSMIGHSKIKLGVFVGPQIRELTKYLKFED
jgi:hypothetical protein